MTWHTAERFTLDPSRVLLALRALHDRSILGPEVVTREAERRARRATGRGWGRWALAMAMGLIPGHCPRCGQWGGQHDRDCERLHLPVDDVARRGFVVATRATLGATSESGKTGGILLTLWQRVTGRR